MGTTNTNVSKKKCQSGLDGMNLEYKISLDGMDKLYLEKEALKNNAGNTIVEIDCVGGKVRVYVNAVNSVRPNNVKPIGIVDAIKLELIQPQVINFIKGYLQKHLQSQYSDKFIDDLKVVSLEVNLTLPCVGGTTPSDAIHLMDMALDKTVVFRKRKPASKCDKVNTSCLHSKPKEYRLKIYDKTCEQHEKGNPLVENNLLRIECVLIDRRLNRAFGEDKRKLKDILSKQAIHSEGPMPFIAYVPLVSDFEEEVYNFGENHPEYELGHYQDILRAHGISAGIESIQNADVSQMDGKSVMALLVCAVRAERYVQGALLDLFESGTIKKWLSRLKEIDG